MRYPMVPVITGAGITPDMVNLLYGTVLDTSITEETSRKVNNSLKQGFRSLCQKIISRRCSKVERGSTSTHWLKLTFSDEDILIKKYGDWDALLG
jgi:hypothetical protein